jgi:hypothetical protein
MTQPVVPDPTAPPVPAALAPAPDAGAPPEAPPPAPAPPKPSIVGVKALHDLAPDAPLTEAYKRGAIGFHEDERVPVRLATGELGSVRTSDLPGVVDAGGELVHPAVLHQAKIEKKYGGAAGAVGAGIAGTARGLTVGLSDPLAVGASRLFGGDEAAEATRERLAAYEELHPYISAGTEIGGAVAPALFSGGATAGVEGAGLLARGGAAAARGVRAAGLATEGVGALGRLAERGTARALARLGEKEGASLARRMATEAVQKGAAGAVEGGLYGAGGAISEATLDPDHELTAEKLLASIGHGAVLGGVLAGGVGAGVEAGKAALAKASPFLRAKGEDLAVRALDAKGKDAKAIDALPGGRSALGRDVLDATIAGEGGARVRVLTARDTIHSLAPKLEQLTEERAASLETHLAPVADATMSLEDLVRPLEARARAFESAGGHEAAARAVRSEVDNIKRIFSPGGKTAMEEIERLRPPKLPKEPPGVNPALAGTEAVHRIGFDPNAGAVTAAAEEAANPIVIDRTRPGHIGEGVMLSPKMTEGAEVAGSPIAIARDEAATAAARQAPIDANRAHRLEEYADQLAAYEAKLAAHDARVAAIEPRNVRVTLKDLLDWRRSFERTVDFRTEGSVVTLGKRAAGRTVEDLIIEHGERAAKERGLEGFAAGYKQAKLEFRRAITARDAVTNAIARSDKNATHSLTDKILAGHGAVAGAIAHGPVGAAVGIAAGELSRQARHHAPALLATTFDKLATLQGIARRTEAVDGEIAAGAKAFVERAQGTSGAAAGERPRLKFRRVSRSREEAREEYARAAAELPAAAGAGAGAAHAAPVAALGAHAPNVTAAFGQRAAGISAFLAAQLPKPPPYGSATPTDQEIHAFLQKRDAAVSPAQTLARGLAHGDLTIAETNAIAATSPKLYAAIQQRIQEDLAAVVGKGHYVDYETRRDLALLFNVDTDWSMTPEGLRQLQADRPPPAQPKPPPGPGPKRQGAARTPLASELQTPIERREGGQVR